MPQKRSDISTYIAVYISLLVLLALTVEAARHDLGHSNFAIALLIASIKAVCIAWFFMHVRQSSPLIKLIVCAGFLWIAIMFTLSLADYWTRDWDSRLIGSPDNMLQDRQSTSRM